MKKHLFVYDLVRVFAILGVIATHTESITTSPTNYLGGISWWFANTIHSLVSVSVPLFVLLSGALILNKPKLTYDYVLPKVLKQFIFPLLMWFLFYSWWNSTRITGRWDFAQLSWDLFFTQIGHLYFLPIIIGLYLIMPLLQIFLKTASRNQQYFFLSLVTLVSIGYEYLSFLVFKTYNSTNILLIFLPFVSYLWWGYFLSKVKLELYQWWCLAACTGFLTILTSIASYLNTLALNQGKTIFWSPAGGNLFWEPLTLPIFLLSIIIFVLLINLPTVVSEKEISRRLASILKMVAATSFGVYLIHPWVMERIDDIFHLSIQFITYPLWIYYLQRTVYVFVASTVLVLIILKIPYLKNIFGIFTTSNIKHLHK